MNFTIVNVLNTVCSMYVESSTKCLRQKRYTSSNQLEMQKGNYVKSQFYKYVIFF